MSTFTFTVVGAFARPAESKEVLKALRPGDTVTLEADPDNEYDSSAVKVMASGHHIGFVPASVNYMVFQRLVDGETFEPEVIAFESTLKPICEVDLGG